MCYLTEQTQNHVNWHIGQPSIVATVSAQLPQKRECLYYMPKRSINILSSLRRTEGHVLKQNWNRTHDRLRRRFGEVVVHLPPFFTCMCASVSAVYKVGLIYSLRGFVLSGALQCLRRIDIRQLHCPINILFWALSTYQSGAPICERSEQNFFGLYTPDRAFERSGSGHLGASPLKFVPFYYSFI